MDVLVFFDKGTVGFEDSTMMELILNEPTK